VQSIDVEALELLRGYSWPGNVRELDHVVQRAMVFAEGETLEARDIEEALPSIEVPPEKDGSPGAVDDVDLDRQLRLSFEDAERRLIKAALEKTGWHRTAAAKLLRITRRTLFTKIEKYSIVESRGGPDESGAGSGGFQPPAILHPTSSERDGSGG
jgi:two-component system response regulator HydG